MTYQVRIQAAIYWVSITSLLSLVILFTLWVISRHFEPTTPFTLFGFVSLETLLPEIALMTLLSVSGLYFVAGNPLKQKMLRSRFEINMEDVGRAYYAAHSADREGVFRLTEQYDSVLERLRWLQQQPDFAELNHEVLVVAAQMSELSRTLAERFSERNVDRAKAFLAEREEQMEAVGTLVSQTIETLTIIRLRTQKLNEEDVKNATLLKELDAEFSALLKPLGYQLVRPTEADNIVPLKTE